MGNLTLETEQRSWPLKAPFRISRGVKTHADTVIARITDGTHTGFGECTPYPRYGESVDSVLGQLNEVANAPESWSTAEALQSALPAGAARNALDCALLDFQAKKTGIPFAAKQGLNLQPVTTAYTLSLDSADNMFQAAQAASKRPVLKIKLGAGPEDQDRLAAVREGAPAAKLIVDANEGWSADDIDRNLEACIAQKVDLIEQPLPAADDAALAGISSPIPLCADESVHTRAGLDQLATRYDAINIKLDKTGGFTEALALYREAKERDLIIMVGCMVASSLAMAPALILAQDASWVDLDGPLLLAEDCDHALQFENSLIHPPTSALWG